MKQSNIQMIKFRKKQIKKILIKKYLTNYVNKQANYNIIS